MKITKSEEEINSEAGIHIFYIIRKNLLFFKRKN